MDAIETVRGALLQWRHRVPCVPYAHSMAEDAVRALAGAGLLSAQEGRRSALLPLPAGLTPDDVAGLAGLADMLADPRPLTIIEAFRQAWFLAAVLQALPLGRLVDWSDPRDWSPALHFGRRPEPTHRDHNVVKALLAAQLLLDATWQADVAAARRAGIRWRPDGATETWRVRRPLAEPPTGEPIGGGHG